MYLSSGPQGVWLKESLGSQDVVNQSPPPPAPKKKKTSLWKRFKNMFRRTKNKKKRCGEVSSTRCVVPLMTKVHLKKGPLTGSWVNIGPDSDADDENSEDYSGIKNFTREIFFKAIDEFETDLKRYRDQHQYLQPNAVMKFTLDEEFEEHAQIRDWEVISKIGKGFGTVYKAKNIHSEMEVVLKKGLYLEESEILFQEAEMMKRLDHQSIGNCGFHSIRSQYEQSNLQVVFLWMNLSCI
uniref:Protein kinase domain-containing protein n=1 Tax=Eptatretus burgeri TaxID=7764 RepID=A0A8C4WW58_EPTBU